MTTTHYDEFVEMFTDPILVPPNAVGDPSYLASPYLGLRHLQARLNDDQPLLADHGRLRTLLELSAVVDPRLFHAMFLHHCMTIGPALDQGADESDLAELSSGRWIGTPLMTELGHGNSSNAVRTEAHFDPEAREFILHTPTHEAAKHPASVGLEGVARVGVVSARLRVGGADRGTALFLVPLRDDAGPRPGVLIDPYPHTSLLPMDYAAVRFEHVRVPYRRWLNDGAFITKDGSFHDPLDGPTARTQRSLGMSRFAWGAVTAGLAAVARASVALALPYVQRRTTFDRLGGALPSIRLLGQQRLLFGAAADALAATVVARRATRNCWHIPPGGGCGTRPSATAMRASALAKVTADVLADATVSRCRSACGAAGFFSVGRLIDYQALTLAFQSAGGDNRMILLDSAWAMADSQDYLPPADERVRDGWIRMFRTRERLLHTELITSLRTAEAEHRPTFESWNDRAGLASRFAEAHAVRTTTEALYEEWHAPVAPYTVRPLLEGLYQLFCLQQVSPHSGWYLARGILAADEVLSLPERIDGICRALAPRADDLVGLLGTPGPLLRGWLT
ncbi:hypothetical protein K7472_19395 [Streptomyces sp. PTM05]|uniref:Acyl-CoA oxidase C-terminal domain-containing protein n=1 Tax=Streptantibioticus parmotrematis TaxID=2873249 RepID=A0ABS7QUY1_9ACTN|nr:acyl-CoA dehydrogenase [Streptantibioticus parmotrematis]MBY8887000.1 hypothetical protein [Streptantibioticus parmotrematis]